MWTTKQKINILLIDDDEDEYVQLSALLLDQLNEPGYPHIHLDWLPSYDTGLEAMQAGHHDVYLIDYRLGGRSGIDLLKEAKHAGVDAPVIILTGQGSYQVDLAAMQLGASDYLVKSTLSLPLLERTIRFALEQHNAQSRLEALVRERTQELEKTVERLAREIDRRERSETQFRTLANTTSAAILIVQDGILRYANPAVRFITGFAPDELTGRNMSDLVHPAYLSAIERLTGILPWSNDFPMRFEIKIMRKGGEERWVDITAGRMDFESQAAWLMTAFDITERDQAERAMKQARDTLQAEVAWRTAELEERRDELRSLYAATSALLTTLTLDELHGQILAAAQSAVPASAHAWLHLVEGDSERLTLCAWRGLPVTADQRPPDFPDGGDYPLMAIKEQRPLLVSSAGLRLKFGPTEHANQARTYPDGASADEHLEIGAFLVVPLITDERVIGALSLSSPSPGVFTESNLHVLENFAAAASVALQNALRFQNVERMATTDPLTQQLNRRAFLEVAGLELGRCRRLGLPAAALMIDLDHFKTINDTLGHAAGDQALRGFVDRCCERIRKIDLLGRIGGDEFAVLLPRADGPAAIEIAERIRLSLAEAPIFTDAGPINLSVSIGVTTISANTAVLESPTEELNLLLRQADSALYAAKESGRNRLGYV